jgi:hypothetical protein
MFTVRCHLSIALLRSPYAHNSLHIAQPSAITPFSPTPSFFMSNTATMFRQLAIQFGIARSETTTASKTKYHFENGQALEATEKARAEDMIQLLAAICNATMLRHQIHIPMLREIPPLESRKLGANHLNKRRNQPGRHDSTCIDILLRDPHSPSTFRSPAGLLCTMGHELAHCWHIDNDEQFNMQWKILVDQIERDLGGRITILRRIKDWRLAQWLDDDAKHAKETASIKPCKQSMDAAWEWERGIWDLQSLVKEIMASCK